MAALLALTGIAGLLSVVWPPIARLGLDVPLAWSLLLAATSAAGLCAGWSAWALRRWALFAYVTWCIVGLAAAGYYQVVLAPRILAVIAEILGLYEPPPIPLAAVVAAFVLHIALLALGGWYLRAQLARARTVPGTPAEERGAPEPPLSLTAGRNPPAGQNQR